MKEKDAFFYPRRITGPAYVNQVGSADWARLQREKKKSQRERLNVVVATKMAGSARKQKRSRLSDAASDKAPTPNEDRVKRRRFSENSVSIDKPSSQAQDVLAVQSSDIQSKKTRPWLFDRPVGGRYTNLDPLVTPDEA